MKQGPSAASSSGAERSSSADHDDDEPMAESSFIVMTDAGPVERFEASGPTYAEKLAAERGQGPQQRRRSSRASRSRTASPELVEASHSTSEKSNSRRQLSRRQRSQKQQQQQQQGAPNQRAQHISDLADRLAMYNVRELTRRVLDPSSYAYCAWLSLMTLAIFFSTSETSFLLAFRQDFQGYHPLVPLTYTLDVLFVANVLVHFRTGYFVSGDKVLDRASIARHYTRSPLGLVEMAACVPLDVLQLVSGWTPYWRVHKLLRLASMPVYLQRLTDASSSPRVIGLLTVVRAQPGSGASSSPPPPLLSSSFTADRARRSERSGAGTYGAALARPQPHVRVRARTVRRRRRLRRRRVADGGLSRGGAAHDTVPAVAALVHGPNGRHGRRWPAHHNGPVLVHGGHHDGRRLHLRLHRRCHRLARRHPHEACDGDADAGSARSPSPSTPSLSHPSPYPYPHPSQYPYPYPSPSA